MIGRRHWIVTLIALLSGLFGAVSAVYNFYSQHRPADLKVYVHGILDYNAPSKRICSVDNFEVLVVPIAAINEGGKTGVITQFNISVSEVGQPSEKRYFIASAVGAWRPLADRCYADSVRPFTPIAIKFGEAIRESIIFFAVPADRRVIRPNTKYRISLSMHHLSASTLGHTTQDSQRIELVEFVIQAGHFSSQEAESELIGLARDGFLLPHQR